MRACHRLGGRLAIVVADEAFRVELKLALERATTVSMPHWTAAFVTAAEATAFLGDSFTGAEDAAGRLVVEAGEQGPQIKAGLEQVIVDHVDQMDGLEQLIVIAVGLDSEIGQVC